MPRAISCRTRGEPPPVDLEHLKITANAAVSVNSQVGASGVCEVDRQPTAIVAYAKLF
jgi:hypothetical protein